MDAPVARIPQLVYGVEIGPDRVAEANVTVAAPGGRYFEVSPATARLLRAVDGRRTISDIARLLSSDAAAVAPDAIAELIDRTLVAPGLVHFGVPPAPQPAPRSRLWLRIPLVPASVVNALAAPFRWVFSRPVAIGIVVAGLAAHAWFYASRPDFGPGFRIGDLAGWIVPAAWFVLATLLHEFGHAAALRSRGESAGVIGFGVYWIWPVLFSDVSRAWQLERRQRTLVDAGGMLVQLGVAAGFIAGWARSHDVALARAILLTDLALVANLNPLLRWDGYWLLVDLTGMTDLRRRSLEHAGALLRGRAVSVPWAVRVYTLGSALFSAIFVLWAALRLLHPSRSD